MTGEIIATKKKTARQRERKKRGEVSKRATQGFVYHPGPSAISLPFGDDTVKYSLLGERDNHS